MEKELEELGLSEHEARIYLAALQMGAFSAGAIADKTKIKRPTAYLALENLVRLGLVREDLSTTPKTFKAERPKALEKLTKRMRRKTISAEILAEKIIPLLSSLPTQGYEEPALSFYKGSEGIKEVLLDVAASKKRWYWFGASQKMLEQMADEDIKEILTEGRKLRWRAWLPKAKFITDDGIRTIPMFQRNKLSLEVKILNQKIDASSALVIYEDKLVVLNFNQKFAVVTKSPEVVDMITLMYNLIWEKI